MEMWRSVWGCRGECRDVQGCVGKCRCVWGCGGVCEDVEESVEMWRGV